MASASPTLLRTAAVTSLLLALLVLVRYGTVIIDVFAALRTEETNRAVAASSQLTSACQVTCRNVTGRNPLFHSPPTSCVGTCERTASAAIPFGQVWGICAAGCPDEACTSACVDKRVAAMVADPVGERCSVACAAALLPAGAATDDPACLDACADAGAPPDFSRLYHNCHEACSSGRLGTTGPDCLTRCIALATAPSRDR